MTTILNAVNMAKFLLHNKLSTASCLMDATLGNGYDTLFMAQHTGNDALIYSFDIQEQALKNSALLLNKHGFENKVRLILDSQENFSRYIERPLDVVMFNLGYLPGADHNITTIRDITLRTVQQILERLSVGGIITIVAYPGHSAGAEEVKDLQFMLSNLPQKQFAIAEWMQLNQVNNPPILFAIERIKE